MKNRRNHYRVLWVQPDAPGEIITGVYRAMMQRLRVHPDLGGDPHHASAVNAAYTTLRNLAKRAEYDRRLLRTYSLPTISMGGRTQRLGSPPEADRYGNQRSFYRILQVQPDAPAAVIEASYRALGRQSKAARPLLDHAWHVLRDPERRVRYDRLLTEHSHGLAERGLVAKSVADGCLTVAQADALVSSDQGARVQPSGVAALRVYDGLRAPYLDTLAAAGTAPTDAGLSADPQAKGRRRHQRVERQEPVLVYTGSPWLAHPGEVWDLSPAGVKLRVPVPLSLGQVVRVESAPFDAQGKVVYACAAGSNLYVGGVRFETVEFRRDAGNFVAVHA